MPRWGRSLGDSRWLLLTALAAAVGLGSIADSARKSSATYDEVAYFKLACDWWRTGRQDVITRMGSPRTFWKIQQAPTLWVLDRAGRGAWIDAPEENQARLLPILRVGSSWIWCVALTLTAAIARQVHGPRAMAMAAWIFALGPNLRAHGGLITMEMPLVAAVAGVALLGIWFLRGGGRPAFAATAALAGLAFSCKFTAILIPPSFAMCWAIAEVWRGEVRPLALLRRIALGMAAFVAIMILADGLVTGFAALPMSERSGDHPALPRGLHVLARAMEMPIPADWVGFLVQMRHQRSGGPSYLFGERRLHGWWSYYLVTLAVKVPPAVWFLALSRAVLAGSATPAIPMTKGVGGARTMRGRGDGLLLVAAAAFVAAASLGSGRNYGVRYLLPVAPLMIAWISGLAEAGRRGGIVGGVGVACLAVSSWASHPHELSYFPAFVGGPRGGRAILADSNLDWGQGLRELARLQRERPAYRDLTLYYFGDTQPAYYGVEGESIVFTANLTAEDRLRTLDPKTRYLAVSSSLQFGPWGPPDFCRRLDGVKPVAVLDDATIAIYATADLMPGSIQVPAARQAFFQPVGGLGDAEDQAGGVDRRERLGQ